MPETVVQAKIVRSPVAPRKSVLWRTLMSMVVLDRAYLQGAGGMAGQWNLLEGSISKS